MSLLNIKLAEAVKPRVETNMKLSKDKPIFNVGTDGRNYFDYLISLFNSSAKHGSIIKNKAKYIFGYGYEYNFAVNKTQKINELLKDIILQYELFNSFFIEVLRNRKGEIVELKSIPCRNICKNIDATKYWYVVDANKQTTGENIVPFFNFGEPSNGCERELFFYNESTPDNSLYPTPGYVQAINYIASDAEVSKHTFTNSKQGFKATKHITLVNGDPSEEEKYKIKKQFSNTYSGESGECVILDFVSDINRKTVIDDLGVSDLVKEDYSKIDEVIRTNIFTAHEVTSPSLFGIATQGALGEKNNLKESYQIFNNIYVKNRRAVIDCEMKKLFVEMVNSVNLSQVIIRDLDPIGLVLDSEDIRSALTRNEFRELLGYEVSNEVSQGEVVNALNSLSPLVATKVLENMTANEVRALVNLPMQEGGNKLNDEAVIKEFEENGSAKNEHEAYISNVNFALTKSGINELLDYVTENPFATFDEISEAIDVPIKDVKDTIDNLNQTGKISIDSKGKIKVIDTPKSASYMVMYSYEWKDEVPANERDTASHPSRKFCQKLIALDKYYSRKDIEKISNKLGYSVFDRAGGWWNSPTGISASCRHKWVSNLVKVK